MPVSIGKLAVFSYVVHHAELSGVLLTVQLAFVLPQRSITSVRYRAFVVGVQGRHYRPGSRQEFSQSVRR